jgi:hypothetical protein
LELYVNPNFHCWDFVCPVKVDKFFCTRSLI